MSIILATWEAEIKRIGVPGQLKKIVHETPISKIARAKWTGGVYEALSSNLSHTHTHTHTKGHFPDYSQKAWKTISLSF
jgi:hypothetical protein